MNKPITKLEWHNAKEKLPTNILSHSKDVLVFLATEEYLIAYVYYGSKKPIWLTSNNDSQLHDVLLWAHLK